MSDAMRLELMGQPQITRPLGAGYARPYLVYQVRDDTLRIFHAANLGEAGHVSAEWHRGIYHLAPGRVQPLSTFPTTTERPAP